MSRVAEAEVLRRSSRPALELVAAGEVVASIADAGERRELRVAAARGRVLRVAERVTEAHDLGERRRGTPRARCPSRGSSCDWRS